MPVKDPVGSSFLLSGSFLPRRSFRGVTLSNLQELSQPGCSSIMSRTTAGRLLSLGRIKSV